MTDRHRSNRTTLRAACPDCGERTELERSHANEAIEFYRRHVAVTGHDVLWERTASVDDDRKRAHGSESDRSLTAGDAETAVRDSEPRFEDGVPIGVVSAALAATTRSIGETLAAIGTARMAGLLYEPHDDRLRTI